MAVRAARAFRRQLATCSAGDRPEVSPDQPLPTSSGTQALDFDLPVPPAPWRCRASFLALLPAHQVTILRVSCTPSGPELARFVIAAERPWLYLNNSALHNPLAQFTKPWSWDVLGRAVSSLCNTSGLLDDDSLSQALR